MRSDINKKLESLTCSLADTFNNANSNDPDLKVIGHSGSTSGEIQLGQFVCAYTYILEKNRLDVWFGKIGTRNDDAGELCLAGEVRDNRWENDESSFSNRQLLNHCIVRLKETAAQNA